VSGATDVVLRASDITKRYGGTQALKGVNFEIVRGKVTTLLGENGAGKSTLMKIMAGVEEPTSGTLELDGELVAFDSTADAADKGISIIHQELSLCPNLSVRDNIFMGRELVTASGIVDYAQERKIVSQLMERLEEKIHPDTLVADLRLGQQQIVEIARALSVDARILIMDEPTSALSASEVEVLFKVIDDLTAADVSIVYISHHLEEALHVSEYVVVLRDGEVVATETSANVDVPWIVAMMVGRDFDLGQPPSREGQGAAALTVDSVKVADPSNPERLSVDGVSLKVRAGEIVCIYGLMGAGRTELLEAVAGKVPLVSGTVLVGDTDIRGKSISERIELGLGLVPEDRQRDGLVPSMSVGHNMSLASLGGFMKGLFLSRSGEDEIVRDGIRDVRVKTEGAGASIGSLSGGNQQKVVIAKMLLTNPKVLLLDEPSRGIDVGAKSEVFGLLSSLAGKGLALLYSTSEAAECLSIANRIIVMRRGKIVAEFGSEGTTQDEIMAASGEQADPSRANGKNR
jgi:erythritol transport system ATP-binding protein